MKLRDKIKSYSFWVSLASAIILILKILGNRFGFVVDETMVSDLFTALCSILVLLGIIVPVPIATNAKINPEQIRTSTEIVNNSPIDFIDKENKLTQINIETESETLVDKSLDQNNENQNTVSIDTLNHSNESKQIDESNLSIENNYQQIQTDKNSKEPFEDNSSFQTEINVQENIESVQEQPFNTQIETNNQDNISFTDLKQTFNDIREKFSGKLDLYILELQEELRKTREGM